MRENSLISMGITYGITEDSRNVICPSIFRMAGSSCKKTEFLAHQSTHRGSLHVYSDAANRGQKVACSAVSLHLGRRSRRLQVGTSTLEAELIGMVVALEMIEKSSFDQFTVFTDSFFGLKMIINHLQHRDVRQVLDVLQTIARLRRDGKFVTLCYVPAHVGISGNERADQAAKLALSESSV